MWLALLVVFAGVRGDDSGTVGPALARVLHDQAGVEVRAVPKKDLNTLVEFTPAAGRVVERMNVDGVVAASVGDGGVLRIVVFDHDGGLVTLFEQSLSAREVNARSLASVISDVKSLTPAVAVEAEPQAEEAEPQAEEAEPQAEEAEPVAEEAEPVTEEAEPVPAIDDAGEVAVEEDPTVAIDLDVGIGFAGRRFAPAPTTLTGYSSTPVPAVRLAGAIRPTRRIALEVAAERAFGMTSHVMTENATTTMSRWRATAVYAMHDGGLHLDAVLGVGRRAFAIEAAEIARTPDSEYGYLELGARLERPLGRRASLRASASFEPVVTGDEPTERMLGPSRRWGLELGAALELRLTRRLRLGVGGDFQRFAWSWPDAGERGAGGAADAYPSGYAVVGAAY